MISREEAARRIARRVRVLPPERAPLSDCTGRVVAEDVSAVVDLPLFDNATMDGFAVRSADLAGARPSRPVALRLAGAAFAGSRILPRVRAGQAVRVTTGAPMPSGADAVVMKEAARAESELVSFEDAPTRGQWVRRRGEDVRRGARIVKAGTILRHHELAVLAAQGMRFVRVRRRPVVAVLSTGDELVEPGRKLTFGQIWDSNRAALLAEVRAAGCRVLDLGIAGDDPRQLAPALLRGLKSADVLLVSGGVSAGELDLTKPLLERFGMRTQFWKVRIKPGKPFLFGLHGSRRLVFGFPGNPVSTLVCFEEFAAPALLAMQGYRPRRPRFHLRGRAENGFDLPADRRQYLFCRSSWTGDAFTLRIIRPQASHMIAACSGADALALPSPGAEAIRRGDFLTFRWL